MKLEGAEVAVLAGLAALILGGQRSSEALAGAGAGGGEETVERIEPPLVGDGLPAGFGASGGSTTTTSARDSLPIVSPFDQRLTFAGLQAAEAAAGATFYTSPSQQGFGGPGATPGLQVPVSAAFGFGGDPGPSSALERRAGLRSELVGSAPEFTSPPAAAGPSALERRADARTERAWSADAGAHSAHADHAGHAGGACTDKICQMTGSHDYIHGNAKSYEIKDAGAHAKAQRLGW